MFYFGFRLWGVTLGVELFFIFLSIVSLALPTGGLEFGV